MDDEQLKEIKKEWSIARGELSGVGLAAISLLSTGAIYFHIAQKLSWVDAFYFCTVTLTTVGYGDIVPKTNDQKIFIMFYILIGIGIIATFANLLIKSASLRREYNRAVRKQKKANK